MQSNSRPYLCSAVVFVAENNFAELHIRSCSISMPSGKYPLILNRCIVLYCTVLYCIVLYCIVLYCIVSYCIVLYCITLYCIVLYSYVLS